MTHPSALPSRSIARTSSGAVSAVSDLDSVTSAGLENEHEQDYAAERYDFILHDSRDDELNGTSSRSKREAGRNNNQFRSVSTGRTAGTAGNTGRVSTAGSVSGGSVLGRATGSL